MVNALHNLAEKIARGEISNGGWGSPSDGAIYRYTEKEHPTEDEYFNQLDTYLVNSANNIQR